MNNLEKEMEQAILQTPLLKDKDFGYIDDHEGQAKACASVAKRWLEKAFNDSVKKDNKGVVTYREFSDWLKENGLIPTEPDTKEPA